MWEGEQERRDQHEASVDHLNEMSRSERRINQKNARVCVCVCVCIYIYIYIYIYMCVCVYI